MSLSFLARQTQRSRNSLYISFFKKKKKNFKCHGISDHLYLAKIPALDPINTINKQTDGCVCS